MEACTVKHLVAALGTMFLCAAPPVSAAMYKWTDADGSVNYSNQPPAEPDKVRGLAEMESTPRPPAEERRTEATPSPMAPEPSLVKPRIAKPEPSLAKPEPTLPKSEPAVSTTEPPLTRSSPAATLSAPTLRSEAATVAPDNNSAKHEADGAQRAPVRGLKEAARDPCLRSSDPTCYQRNKDRYHPYLGYAPAVTPPGSTASVGATSAMSGVGAVGGQVVAPAASATSRRIETPLIFFDQPPSKKRRSR